MRQTPYSPPVWNLCPRPARDIATPADASPPGVEGEIERSERDRDNRQPTRPRLPPPPTRNRGLDYQTLYILSTVREPRPAFYAGFLAVQQTAPNIVNLTVERPISL